MILPVSVNKIKEGAFDGVTQSDGKHILDVTIKGREVDIADSAFSPKNGVIIRSYIDSAAKRYADRYHPPVEFRELGSYRVKFFDYDGTQAVRHRSLSVKKVKSSMRENLKRPRSCMRQTTGRDLHSMGSGWRLIPRTCG